MNAILQVIYRFADEAHGEQMRKYTPDRYMVHPLRVMETCSTYTTSIPVLAAALLHDVLEDTPVTAVMLLRYLKTIMQPDEAAHTLRLVVELTDVFIKEDYPYWNRKVRKGKEAARMAGISAEAQTIKYADILDNCSEIVVADPQFAPRFLRECKMLLAKMNRGNKDLYELTVRAVADGLDQLHQR